MVDEDGTLVLCFVRPVAGDCAREIDSINVVRLREAANKHQREANVDEAAIADCKGADASAVEHNGLVAIGGRTRTCVGRGRSQSMETGWVGITPSIKCGFSAWIGVTPPHAATFRPSLTSEAYR